MPNLQIASKQTEKMADSYVAEYKNYWKGHEQKEALKSALHVIYCIFENVIFFHSGISCSQYFGELLPILPFHFQNDHINYFLFL